MGIMQVAFGDDLAEELSCYEGVFYNYFSIGKRYAFSFCINSIRTYYSGTGEDL